MNVERINCRQKTVKPTYRSADAGDLVLLDKYQGSDDPTAFGAKVQQIAMALGADPNWLMAVMYAESKLNPQAVNPKGGATGLIQFMPSTAQGLSTTTAALKAMTGIQQLDYVLRYFQPYAGKMKSYYDVYSVVFFPAIIPHSDDDSWIVQTSKLSSDSVTSSNPAIAKFGTPITVGSFKQYVQSTVPSSVRSSVFAELQAVAQKITTTVENNPAMAVLFVLGAVGIVAVIMELAGGDSQPTPQLAT